MENIHRDWLGWLGWTQGLSQSAIADLLKVSRGAVNNWASGQNEPSPTIRRLLIGVIGDLTEGQYFHGPDMSLSAVVRGERINEKTNEQT